jgi:hypothetical protein
MKIMARIVADSWRSADAIARDLRVKGYAIHISESVIVDEAEGNYVFMEATKDFAPDVDPDAATHDVCLEVDEIADVNDGMCLGAGTGEEYLANPWDEP